MCRILSKEFIICTKEIALSFYKTFCYLVKHKYYVFKYGLNLQVPIAQLIIHDYTKFYPSLFIAYSLKWQYESNDKNRFDNIKKWVGFKYRFAFNKHQKTEKHHWQYFCLIKGINSIIVLDMPEKYIREMVADWASAGQCKYGKFDLMNWFVKNADKINVTDPTRVLIEKYVKKLNEIYN